MKGHEVKFWPSRSKRLIIFSINDTYHQKYTPLLELGDDAPFPALNSFVLYI